MAVDVRRSWLIVVQPQVSAASNIAFGGFMGGRDVHGPSLGNKSIRTYH
jgi:hypothetical protein